MYLSRISRRYCAVKDSVGLFSSGSGLCPRCQLHQSNNVQQLRHLLPLTFHSVGPHNSPSPMMAIAEASSPSVRNARVAPGNLFRRMSAQAMGMEAAALCHRSHWVPKSSRSSCSNCRRSFRLWAGKHHCRLCGEVVCGACSTKRILFQKKSVRTCDDCVDANVQNISEINRRRSTPEFLRSNTSPAAIGDDRYERRSLQVSSRGLQRHHSSFVSTSLKEETATTQELTVSNYRITFSWQTQVMSLVIAALVAAAIKLMTQV